MDEGELVAALGQQDGGRGWHSGTPGLYRSDWLQAPASSSNRSPYTLTPCCDSEPIINEENESDGDAEPFREERLPPNNRV